MSLRWYLGGREGRRKGVLSLAWATAGGEKELLTGWKWWNGTHDQIWKCWCTILYNELHLAVVGTPLHHTVHVQLLGHIWHSWIWTLSVVWPKHIKTDAPSRSCSHYHIYQVAMWVNAQVTDKGQRQYSGWECWQCTFYRLIFHQLTKLWYTAQSKPHCEIALYSSTHSWYVGIIFLNALSHISTWFLPARYATWALLVQ